NAMLTVAKRVAETAARTNAELSRKNQLILETAAEGIFGLDGDGNVTFFNQAASEILGWTAADLIGRSVHPMLHPLGQSNAPIESCSVCRPSSTHHSTRSVDFRTSNEELIPVEYSVAVIRDEEGCAGGTVVTFRDVRERL